jgi:uncharacterized membrane protein YtjA (UPF0391 family)
MIYYSAVFFIMALIAAIVGFGGIGAHDAMVVMRVLFFVFLAAFVTCVLVGVYRASVNPVSSKETK